MQGRSWSWHERIRRRLSCSSRVRARFSTALGPLLVAGCATVGTVNVMDLDEGRWRAPEPFVPQESTDADLAVVYVYIVDPVVLNPDVRGVLLRPVKRRLPVRVNGRAIGLALEGDEMRYCRIEVPAGIVRVEFNPPEGERKARSRFDVRYPDLGFEASAGEVYYVRISYGTPHPGARVAFEAAVAPASVAHSELAYVEEGKHCAVEGDT
nr:hypothetical protein [Gammaproteobacteria bacterium]